MTKDYDKPRLDLTDEEAEFARMMDEGGGLEVGPSLEPGETVSGRIISMGRESTFIEVGGKAEAVIDTSEILELELKPGDTIEAIVVSTQGEIRLSRTLAAAQRDSEAIRTAYDMGLPIQGKITGRNKGGFEVSVGGMAAFMPVSQLAIENIDDLDAWIGRTERLKIVEYEPKGRRFVVSRAAVIREERAQKAEQLWEELSVGDVREGEVKSIMDYGCFVDIGGADGLVHVRELHWGRIDHPSEVVTVGQKVSVTIASLDHEKKRIGLSMKATAENPWKKLGTEINVGDTLRGEVTRLEHYGCFVEILPGLEGLVHISELTYLKRLRHPNEITSPGASVQVVVLDIDHAKQRVGLSMKQVEGDPWDTAHEDFPIGAQVTGTVERTAPFGVFVQVGPGVTALLPGSESGQPQGADLARHFKPGELVTAVVLSVDPAAKRMSLSCKAAGEASETANVASWQRQNQPTAGFGTFADLLKGVKLKDL